MTKTWLLLIYLTFAHLCYAESNSPDVTPPQVYKKANELNVMLTEIAKEMGIAVLTSIPIDISEVSPREVYFQAATLHLKTGRLMFEFSSREGEAVSMNKLDARPADVLELLFSSESHLLEVTKTLGMKGSGEKVQVEKEAQSKDVFQLIVQLNRLTNQLLDFKFSPAESHQKVTESIALASAILQTYPNASAVFYPVPHVSGKTPTDVYQKLASMYQDLSLIFKKFEKSCLILGDSELKRVNVLPSDVYDLAVLFASQLGYWHSILPSQPNVRQSYYPGKVLPSDVYQRLSILDKQVEELMRVNSIPQPGR